MPKGVFSWAEPQFFSASITDVIRNDGYTRITLGDLAFPSFAPGQFVKVSAWPGEDPSYVGDRPDGNGPIPLTDSYLKGPYPLLGRAFSISMARFASGNDTATLLPDGDSQLSGIDLLARVVGVGTQIMEALEPGQTMEIRGPLGQRGYWWEPDTTAFLAGGGAGVAPMLPLAQALRADAVPVTVFIGAKSGDEIPPQCVEDLEGMNCEVIVVTEDGSAGERGLITGPLREHLEKAPSSATVYACGPEPMLHALSKMCETLDRPLQVSLESKTACGIGSCLGCTVVPKEDAPSGYAKVCVHGPVFDGRSLQWE